MSQQQNNDAAVVGILQRILTRRFGEPVAMDVVREYTVEVTAAMARGELENTRLEMAKMKREKSELELSLRKAKGEPEADPSLPPITRKPSAGPPEDTAAAPALVAYAAAGTDLKEA